MTIIAGCALEEVALHFLVFLVHFGLIMRVAKNAFENFGVGYVDVAFNARQIVRPFCNGEVGFMAKFTLLTIGMTEKALCASIKVAWNARVCGVHFGLPVLVAVETGELLAVGRVCVAFETFLPTALMCAAKDGEKEIVMIDKITFAAIRVTGQAGCAFVGIA